MVLVGLSFSVPLIKSLRRELPPPLPGIEGAAVDFVLPDEYGDPLRLADQRGSLVMLTGLTLANAEARDRTFDGIRRVRRRVRNLAGAVRVVVLAHGGPVADLSALLDARIARKPTNVYLMDERGEELERVREAASSPNAAWLLIDRHGRVRGSYGPEEDEIDRLVTDTGHLANWLEQDPPPGSAGP